MRLRTLFLIVVSQQLFRMSICKILMEKQSLLQRLLRDDKNRITSKAKGWKMVFISVYQAQLD